MTTRRQFLQTSAALSTAALLTHVSAKDAPMDLPVIDTHQHLWDLSKFKLAWHDEEGVGPLRKSFLPADYDEATKGLNIVKTVYMEVDVKPEQQVAEAEYVLGLCKQPGSKMAGAVISGRPASTEFAAYIQRFAKEPHIKGVRQVLHGPTTPAGYCLQPQFVKSVQLLGELGLCYDLCMRAADLMDGVKLAQQCPKTQFVVDHCGNMPTTSTDAAARGNWLKAMQAFAALPNTVCKISGIVADAKKDWTAADLAPVINDSLQAFGEDRVMFAGDWPVCTLRATFAQWLNALKTIVKDRPVAFQRKLFHDNAVKFYGLG